MANEEQNQSFGIENTINVDNSAIGDTTLIDSLYETESNPDNVNPIENEEDDTTNKGGKGAAEEGTTLKKEENVSEETASNPDTLTNFLLDNEKEEEGNEDDNSSSEEDTNAENNNSNKDDDDEDNSSEKDNEDNDDDESVAFDSLANDLFNLGVFTKEEGEDDVVIKSPKEFLDRFNNEKEKGAQQMISNFIGQFGQEHQDAFQAIYVKGVNPREYFGQSAKIEDFTNLDLTKEGNQEKVVRQALTDQGYESEDVNGEIDKLKNYGDLEDASKRHHKVLIKKEKQALANKQAAAQTELENKQIQKDAYINNVREVLTEKLKAKEFDGIPLNSNTANELQDFLLVDKWKTESGETLTDFDRQILELKRPENHANKVKIALLLKLLEKDPTLSTIKKRGVSQESSTLFKEMARQKTTSKRDSGSSKKGPAKSWFQK